MDWQFILKDVKVVTPENVGFVNRAFAGPIARYINSRQGEIDLRFMLVMDEEEFKAKPSLGAAGLWEAVVDGTAKAIAERSKNTVEDVKEGIGHKLESWKRGLEERRKDDD